MRYRYSCLRYSFICNTVQNDIVKNETKQAAFDSIGAATDIIQNNECHLESNSDSDTSSSHSEEERLRLANKNSLLMGYNNTSLLRK